ncbi:MAG: Trk system potassium transporter TrkA [Bacteroidales bacterium]|nr:Trk system potassium transporter TrkA [Candidatus Scybalousia scybalohippi]MCQ2326888.1 Trk system potassium transporter TrkA [Bacteroidales bacterium]
MNIIIAGDGEVGFHLAKTLSKVKHNITVVDPHSDLLDMLQSESDLLTITGNSTSIETLKEANVSSCDLLISVLHQESINIITCMLGKKLGAKRTIARVSSIEYLDEVNKNMFKTFGIDEMVCPERIAAKEITNLLNSSTATEIFEFSHGLLSIYMTRIESDVSFVDKTVAETAKLFPQLEARVVCIVRHGQTIIPGGSDYYRKGDLVYLLANKEGLSIVKELFKKKDVFVKNVMIIGGGRIGRRTALNLENDKNVKIVEEDTVRGAQLVQELKSTMVLHGSGSDMNFLISEGLRDTDAFIATTDSTETNILSCLHAHRQGVKKTIALVENINYIDVSQDIGIETIINKKLITASYIARFTLNGDVTSSKWLSGIDAEVFEVIVKEKSPATKKMIMELKIPSGVSIGGVIRDGQAFIAKGNTRIEAGDKVVVFSLPESADNVMKLFN